MASQSGFAKQSPSAAGNSATIKQMYEKLTEALQEAEPLIASRGWTQPTTATVEAAERLLKLVAKHQRQPTVQVDPTGTISFEWEAADHGWLTLTVNDHGQLTHGAVLGEDEFTQTEAFSDELPDWANSLLQRLLAAGH